MAVTSDRRWSRRRDTTKRPAADPPPQRSSENSRIKTSAARLATMGLLTADGYIVKRSSHRGMTARFRSEETYVKSPRHRVRGRDRQS